MARSAVCLVLCVALAVRAEVRAERVSKCPSVGALVCDANCENLVLCLGEPEGAENPFREESVETCDAAATPATYCYSPSQRCETRNSCEPDTTYEFECTTLGQLPHPTDCTKYFLCVPQDGVFVAHERDCDPGFAYNAARGFCNLPLTHPTCIKGPVPPCNEVGDFGVLPENTSIYYVCKRRGDDLVPVLFVCKFGGTFDDATATCITATKSHVQV